MEAVYNFLQKVIIFLRSSVAQDSIKNDATHLDDLLPRANSTVLEAQLMSHDAGVTATELYTHLHMLHRRTVLESSSVDLSQHDKNHLLIMSKLCPLWSKCKQGARMENGFGSRKSQAHFQSFWWARKSR